MPLRNTGVLTGTVTGHGPQTGGNPHYLFEVQAGLVTLRAAINLGADLLHLFVERMTGDAVGALVRAVAGAPSADGIWLASAGAPKLDYVRGGVVQASHIRYRTAPEAQLARLAAQPGRVAIFGTGYPDQDDRPRFGTRGLSARDPVRASFGLTGIDNIHMNQGSPLRIGNHLDRHFDENGPDQDGAVLFLHEDGSVTGYFSRFATQSTQTDAHGNPVQTGVAELDAIKPADRQAVLRPRRAAAPVAPPAARAAGAGAPATTRTTVATPAPGRIFADPAPVDPTRVFQPDIDDTVRNSPDSKKFGMYGVPEPVPGPRDGAYPTMTLASVLGNAAEAAIRAAGRIVFHTVGDTGSPGIANLPNETSVADLMTQQMQQQTRAGGDADRPAFFFHLGDVVYYYGEQEYYYDQFYKPWKDYPAPIFAIPGNHDGITYSDDMVSLEGFIAAFCDTEPRHWSGAGGISRTTMTQPGVYFTLDAPFVSIIGLYSNCSEHYGFLDDQQKLFLLHELQRLRGLRDGGEFRAVLLAVHHPPLSFSPSKASSASMRDDIDAAAKQAGLWPDAVFSGHAHLYQRVTRTVGNGEAGSGQDRQIPYIVCGAGGYAVNQKQEVDKAGFAQMDVSDPQFVLHRLVPQYGFLRVTVTPPAGGAGGMLRTEYFAPTISDTQPADVCVLDLGRHAIL